MKSTYLIIISFLISSAYPKAQMKDQSPKLNKIEFISEDINNFYDMLLHLNVAKSTQDSIDIIQKHYINNASNGLKEYWETEKQDNKKNIEKEYLKIIRAYPKYFQSLKPMIDDLPNHFTQYQKYFKKLKKIYPEALFYKNYFSIGFFNTQGQMLSSRSVFVSTEACLTNPSINYSEFSKNFFWIKEDAGSLEDLGYLIVHENLHSQQKTPKSKNSFLNTAIVEGAAVFLTAFICGEDSLIGASGLGKDMFETAKHKGKTLWEEFSKDLINHDSSQWFFNDNGKYPFAMGYYMGYMICKSFYERSKNKKEALKILIEAGETDLIYKNSQYYKKM